MNIARNPVVDSPLSRAFTEVEMLIYSEPYTRRTARLGVTLTREDDAYMLDVTTARNAPEILYRLAAVLYVHKWDIHSAEICTLDNNEIRDRFVIRPVIGMVAVDELLFDRMMDDFERLIFDKESVLGYIGTHGKNLPNGMSDDCHVDFRPEGDCTFVTVRGMDRPGLLLSLCQVFTMMEIDILEARINTEPGGRAANSFLVNPCDRRFINREFRDRVREAVRSTL